MTFWSYHGTTDVSGAPKGDTDVKATVELPPDLIARLESLARREHRAPDELIRDVLTRYAEARDRGHPSWAGILADPSISSEDVDDYIAANWKPM